VFNHVGQFVGVFFGFGVPDVILTVVGPVIVRDFGCLFICLRGFLFLCRLW
jgi:hypothetical protein